MIYRKTIVILCLLALSSCINFKVEMNGYSSNYNIAKKQCADQFCSEGSELGSNKDSCLLKISNGIAVKSYLARFPKAVLYLWDPECKSSACISLEAARRKCAAQNAQLVVVAEFFDCEKTAIFVDKQHPIICIDPHYYKSNLTSHYLPKFLFDITGIKNLHLYEGRYFFFENGKFVTEKQTFE